MVYKHAYLNTLLLLHTSFMLSAVKMPLIGEDGGHALYSHGNYIVDHRKYGIVFLNFCGNPACRAVSSESNCRSRGCELDPSTVPYFRGD